MQVGVAVRRIGGAAARRWCSGGFESQVIRSKRSVFTISSGVAKAKGSGRTDSVLAYPSSPRFLFQHRGAKVVGSEVRTGNIVNRKGRIYQVIKAQHTQHGRGGATIQVELRDVDTGNKVTERFRTDEAIEKVYVEDKSFKYLYSEADLIVLTDPETYEQVEVPKDLFGTSAVYLKEDMTVKLQYYDDRPMSATLPYRVTCTVVEAQAPKKGLSVNAQYKKVLLDNGLTVLAPPFIVAGDKVVINTDDHSYFTREK